MAPWGSRAAILLTPGSLVVLVDVWGESRTAYVAVFRAGPFFALFFRAPLPPAAEFFRPATELFRLGTELFRLPFATESRVPTAPRLIGMLPDARSGENGNSIDIDAFGENGDGATRLDRPLGRAERASGGSEMELARERGW